MFLVQEDGTYKNWYTGESYPNENETNVTDIGVDLIFGDKLTFG